MWIEIAKVGITIGFLSWPFMFSEDIVLLKRLWAKAFPVVPYQGRVDSRWRELGFQVGFTAKGEKEFTQCNRVTILQLIFEVLDEWDCNCWCTL